MTAKFLIAHPDTFTVNALELVLRDEHHQARIAREGLDAIDRALDEKPDAIILGLGLPGLSGLDVARALRALEPTRHIPILFVAHDAEEAAAIARAGVPHVDCLVSPVDLLRFREEAERMLNSNRPLPQLLSTDGEERIAAITDEVTGLYSRHYMLHRLAYEAARAARYKTPLSCLLFGVEDYDALVEKLGYPTGDRVLAQLAAIFRRAGRTVDLVGRSDTAEFLMVAPHTDERGAERTAARLHSIMHDHHFDLPAPFNRINIAVGYASALGGSVAENLALLARAGGALSEARAEGHNKIAEG
ncbi:MAG: diguanylate cyclase [Rudaea sp.]